MKQSEFNRAIKRRLRLLTASTKFSFQEALAYPLNNLGGLISSLVYLLTSLVFLKIIYSRVTLVAGYNYGEMLFFTLVGNINLFLFWIWSIPNIKELGRVIRTGELDLVLIRPLPVLWFLSLRRLKLTIFLFDGLPIMLPLLYLVTRNLGTHLTLLGIVSGSLVFLLGQLLFHSLHFIITLVTFWTGESEAATQVAEELCISGMSIPWEGFPANFRTTVSLFLPVLIGSALASSYFLGKTTSFPLIGLLFVLTIVFVCAKVRLWRFALRHYSSASS